MIPWQPKHFAKNLDALAKELLPPKVYQKHGLQGLRLLDMDVVMFLDEFRYDCGVPLTVNTPWNEQFTQSGLRDDEFYGSFEKHFWSLSDHTRGAALDVKCKHGGAWLRQKFIEREQYYYEKYGINFVEVSPVKSGGKWVEMSWAHFSKRWDFFGEVKYWSPRDGYVDKQQVIDEKL